MKKIISLIFVIVLVLSVFTACSAKPVEVPQETLDLMTANGFPSEFIPTVAFTYTKPYISYVLKSQDFETLQQSFRDKLTALEAETSSDLDTDTLVAAGVFPGFDAVQKEMGMNAWIFEGLVDEKDSIYITLQEQRMGLIKYTYVMVAYEEIPEEERIPHTHAEDGSIIYENDSSGLEGQVVGEIDGEDIVLVPQDNTAEDPSAEVAAETPAA